MRIIVEAFGRAWGGEFNILRVKLVSPDDAPEQEEFEHVPTDPHSTLSAHIERRSDIEDAYGHGQTLKAQRPFGFTHGLNANSG